MAYPAAILATWYLLDGVVNQQRHNREVRVRCTKYPPTFGITLLVDDSEGVRLEGERYGFRVVVVQPEDLNWVNTVQAAVQRLAKENTAES
ncbi:hypothetical protein [Hymenobacter sp. AT01-02]|uniref:hypothetical protein n=1 Tax=Hymenobacter sp. AT01-02 TaxID=1571877 RepID=UPI00191BEB9F|nr:hypothetical protein [Hymenobacter sp. AT01-02]